MAFKALFLVILIFSFASSNADSITANSSRQTPHYSKIVTLAPVLAEWTAEILGDAGTKAAVIAVSEYSLYPHSMTAKPTIGAYFKLNIEKIAALKPDLIVASSVYNRPEQLEQLKRLNLPVQVMPEEKFSDMPAWIKSLGDILHEDAGAAHAAARWIDEIKALEAKKKKTPQSLFLEVQHSPLVTIGGESFLNEAFASVGYENIFKGLPQAYPKVSKESVLAKKPDQIFILDLSGDPKDFAPAVAEWEKFGKHPQILSGDDFARCSFALLKGLRQL